MFTIWRQSVPLYAKQVQKAGARSIALPIAGPRASRVQAYQLYILHLVQPEDGSSCTSRNMLAEDTIEKTFQ
jgi:hypothetical protein